MHFQNRMKITKLINQYARESAEMSGLLQNISLLNQTLYERVYEINKIMEEDANEIVSPDLYLKGN